MEARKAQLGWLFVAVQAGLIAGLVLLPGRNDWPTPDGMRVFATGLSIAGFVGLGAAALRLGRALTPTPVPKDDATLVVTGLYRFVRHPIYTSVLVLVVGIVLRSGSVLTAALGVATFAFFNTKAAWEERRLAERYAGYAAYAARTPRFIPRPWVRGEGRGRVRR